MIHRACPHCGSELVRARSTDKQAAPGSLYFASPGWRCSVCGGEFTTEQIREGNRALTTTPERT
jgi:YgiT-type zinc finger domain-containing protein